MENLARALASDLDKAFAELVCELQHGVFSGILQLAGDHHRAQDLTQEAFIRAYLALRTYPSERLRSMRLRGWVWTITLNLLRNQIRSQTLRPVPVRLEDAGYIPTEPPDSRAWQRRWALLRHVAGLSYQEISEAAARPRSTARSDVHRGLNRLRAIIEQEHFEEERNETGK